MTKGYACYKNFDGAINYLVHTSQTCVIHAAAKDLVRILIGLLSA